MQVPPILRHLTKPALFVTTVLVLDSIQLGFGGLLFSVALLFIVAWLIYSLVRLMLSSSDRKARAIRMATWAATIVGLTALLGVRDRHAREEIAVVVRDVQEYKAKHGAYPSRLEEASANSDSLRKKYSMNYRVEPDDATLFYSQPSMPLVAHHFRFRAGTWEKRD